MKNKTLSECTTNPHKRDFLEKYERENISFIARILVKRKARQSLNLIEMRKYTQTHLIILQKKIKPKKCIIFMFIYLHFLL